MVTPASARTRPSPSCTVAPPRTRTATPRTPPSPTRRFEPPPTIVTGTPLARANSLARRSSAVSRTSTRQSAGPPTLKVVNGPSGAPRRTRSAPKTVRRASKVRSSSGHAAHLARSRGRARVEGLKPAATPFAARPAASRGCRRSRRSTSAPRDRRRAARATSVSTMSSTAGM